MTPIPYICPACGPEKNIALAVAGDRLSCPTCNASWPIQHGIPLFTRDIYWGEMPEGEMKDYLEDIQQRGLEAASAALQAREPGVFQFIFDPARADWRFGMEVKPTDRVLDVGCGMGGNAFGLCDLVDQVVSFDLSLARAKFVKLRAEHEGKKNIQVFLGDFMELPLAEGQFDIVVFNGILEWIGQSMKFADAYQVQQWVMKKCLSLLRPGGRMYVGIENRYSFSYLSGSVDHVGLNFTTWMPRFIARPYTKWRLGKDYRTYTHGKPGYVKLFKDAGFADVNVLMPFPGYNDQRMLIPFDDIHALRFAILNLMGGLNWRKQLVKTLSAFPFVLSIYRYFFFSYDIYGVKPSSYDSRP